MWSCTLQGSDTSWGRRLALSTKLPMRAWGTGGLCHSRKRDQSWALRTPAAPHKIAAAYDAPRKAPTNKTCHCCNAQLHSHFAVAMTEVAAHTGRSAQSSDPRIRAGLQAHDRYLSGHRTQEEVTD